MQRYNPMTKCLETVKTNDRKTVDNDIALLINRIMKDAQKIQDVSKEMLRNKLAERIDERGRKNLNTMIVMLEKSIQELANISYRSYPFKDRKTVDSKIKTVNASELKQGNTIVQTGEKIISVENIGDKVKIVAKRVLAGGATPSIYKVAPNTKIKIIDKKTVDRIPVKKVLKALKSKLNVYYIIEDTDGRYWVTTKKDGSGGGTLEFSMSNAIKTAQNYIKMDELTAKYGKEEGYKKWMRGEDRKTVDAKTFYSVTYYVMGRGKETKFFDNPNDAMKFYNKADRADKPKKLTYSNPQKIKELEEYIREQNAYSRYY